MSISCDLANRHCKACEGGIPVLADGEVNRLLGGLDGWQLTGGHLERSFRFRTHYEAMAFVNAVAWISHGENHHPEMTVGYRDVRVSYWTHAINGLTENDFICAAKIQKLTDFSG